MSRAIVLLSGGLDSATALWWAKRRWQVYALTVKYDKLNTNEVRSAKRLAGAAKVARHILVDLKFLKQMSELEHEAKKQRKEWGRFPRTYIPSRNTIFFGIASYYAEIYDAKYIVTGHITRDPFPDSKPTYIRAMNEALAQGGWLRKHRIRIITPFGRTDKIGIIRLALKLGVPIELTWSCHRDRKTPCQSCEGCISRSNALKKLNLTRG